MFIIFINRTVILRPSRWRYILVLVIGATLGIAGTNAYFLISKNTLCWKMAHSQGWVDAMDSCSKVHRYEPPTYLWPPKEHHNEDDDMPIIIGAKAHE